MIRTRTPSLVSHKASTRPVGPAPMIRTRRSLINPSGSIGPGGRGGVSGIRRRFRLRHGPSADRLIAYRPVGMITLYESITPRRNDPPANPPNGLRGVLPQRLPGRQPEPHRRGNRPDKGGTLPPLREQTGTRLR